MTSRFFIGGKITKVELSNIDLQSLVPKVTSKPFSIHKYSDLTFDHEFMYWTILLYQYPGQIGHWTLLKCDRTKKLVYFFDPYGTPPDKQWPYLENPQFLPEPYHMLTTIIRRYLISDGYRFFSIITTFREPFETEIFEIQSEVNLSCYGYSMKIYPTLSSIRYA
jgi:hypothetical protein